METIGYRHKFSMRSGRILNIAWYAENINAEIMPSMLQIKNYKSNTICLSQNMHLTSLLQLKICAHIIFLITIFIFILVQKLRTKKIQSIKQGEAKIIKKPLNISQCSVDKIGKFTQLRF
jgi:hypothetical protein